MKKTEVFCHFKAGESYRFPCGFQPATILKIKGELK